MGCRTKREMTGETLASQEYLYSLLQHVPSRASCESDVCSALELSQAKTYVGDAGHDPAVSTHVSAVLWLI